MTAFSVGVAQESGLLSIEDPSTTYLGEGWTSLNPEQEELITIRHQLTMTTGLDDGLENTDCTNSDCLSFLELNIQTKDDSVYDKLTIMDLHGRIVRTEVFSNFIDVSSLDTGIYFL